MGVGRREFLRLFGLSVVAYAAAPSAAVGISGDVYLNRRLGVGFRKPVGWSFVDIATMGEIKEGVLLATDETKTKEVLEWMDLPFVSIGQKVDSPNQVSPCSHFILTDRLMEELDAACDLLEGELNRFEGKPTLAVPRTVKKLQDDIEASAELLKSFRIIARPREFRLSECDAAEYTAAFLYEHRDLETPVEVRQRTIYVAHNDVSYLIRLVDAPSEGAEFDFDPFVNGIVLA